MKKLYLLPALVLSLLISIKSFAVPQLNSLPGATAVIFLDFDGHYVQSVVWNGGSPINCAASDMTDLQITEAFNRTSEDYRPFNINITTDSAVFLAAPLNRRIRVIVTPTSWYPGVGGVAYIGSFTWGDDSPAFVFCDKLGPNNPKYVGECCSHESGHTLGLSHQSKYDVSNCPSPIEPYNTGIGSGETGWAPIMGNSYYKNMSNWNLGPTPYGCTNMEDHLSIITSQNGFAYRPDDFTETLNASTTLLTPGNFIQQGIISTSTDKDAFKFTVTQNSNFHLTAVPFNVGAVNAGADIDIKLQLYNNTGTLINTYDPAATMSVTVDTILNTGSYYLKIDGSGNSNVGEYGSLGSYTITGLNSLLPIRDVALTGTTGSSTHNLAWNIVADEPIKTIMVEGSTDGVNFKNLATLSAGAKNFSYAAFQNTPVYYRLKVISVADQTVYSNTIVLNGISNTGNQYHVSTLIQNEITVNAAAAYQYRLADINGRVISKGNGTKGFNNINISNHPNGIYIIQIISNNQSQTERIIKQ